MPDLTAETDEGSQELKPRHETSSTVNALERGAVLRGASVSDDVDVEITDDETMIINMGPQHPSTHGVLRLMLELDGETVLRCKPIIGYLHTGMEKTGEELTYVQEPTNVTRMDYASPMTNELVFSMAVEKLLEIEVPERAQWIRMLMHELTRMASHLLFLATNGMDLGAISMMIYGFRDRESVLAFFEKATGLRMNHNYIRPGGVAADLPDGWRDDGYAFCSDLTAVDYLLAVDRPLPVGVTPERFEVVVSLLSMDEGRRIRVRAHVPEQEPTLPTLFELFPGTEAMEREVYDMFGIVFDGHPDLTRILMPDDWEGHPLRKDYPIGRIPVQFKEAPGPR